MTRAITRPAGVERGGIPLARNKRMLMVNVDISSYTTGGEAFAPADVGMKRFDSMHITASEPVTAANRDSILSWDKANVKLFASVLSTGLQVAAAVDLGSYEVIIVGR
jgi:hypothetical protein